MPPTWKTEAIVLRSFRYGEADRILHLLTLERGRVGAIAKGARKARSRFGGRLEPMSHVALVLHRGRGELHTVTAADLIRSYDEARTNGYRLAVGSVGLEAVLRLFGEEDPHPEVFHALARFLDRVGRLDPGEGARAPFDPLTLSFQLKLLWLAGYLPHLESCAACGSQAALVGFSARAGGAVCQACQAGSLPLSPEGLLTLRGLLERPLASAGELGMAEQGLRETLQVVEASYEVHGGFRLRTLARS